MKYIGATYSDIESFMSTLNKCGVEYLILRNFEELYNESIYVGGHEDIDILCTDSIALAKALGAAPNKKKEDKVHYHVFVGGNRVNLDLRHIGDGYYDKGWETTMLSQRIFTDGFYKMDQENYYYSLIYHAVFHKSKFADDYQKKLAEMAIQLEKKANEYSTSYFLKELEHYMRLNNYYYTYTTDNSIPLNLKKVSPDLIHFNMPLSISHRYFQLKQKAKRFIKRIIRE